MEVAATWPELSKWTLYQIRKGSIKGLKMRKLNDTEKLT